LPNGSVVVDVGGGVGTSSLPLAEAYPNLEIVIQDRPPVVEDGLKVRANIITTARVNYFFLAVESKTPKSSRNRSS
jgi:ubiquinone/menaquinone biosynthesis C-methylase UbiE